MQITITPDPQLWVVIPEFPPPGWARAEASARAHQLAIASPQWRTEFEALLEGLRRTERLSSLARLLHVGDGAQSVFAVDISLVPSSDNGSKEGRRAAQRAILAEILPHAPAHRLRPNPGTAGFWAVAQGSTPSHPQSPGAVVILRKAGLPTVPVDAVMRVWGAPPAEIEPDIADVVDLAEGIGPADPHSP